MEQQRCAWANRSPLLSVYHDEEWGRQHHDDLVLFEQMVLVTFQAGLSWELILKKRPAMRRAFVNFDPSAVARFDETNIKLLLGNPDIIRNGAKLRAMINNARCFVFLQQEFGSFDEYLWRFAPVLPEGLMRYPSLALTASPASEVLAKNLRDRGFKFVGPVTCHSYMQSVGMFGNPHDPDCFLGHSMTS